MAGNCRWPAGELAVVLSGARIGVARTGDRHRTCASPDIRSIFAARNSNRR